jgi:two-component system, chemotaxis family, CheB/CheR fusion protein
MQATQEELRAANEELQSNNEELQSTNEELNSSKEELQSLNEEMQTVNAELQSKIEELSQSNSDMKNLLNGTEIATIFLDNPPVRQAVHAAGRQDRQSGRQRRGASDQPFHDEPEIRPARPRRQEVLDTLVPRESQVQARTAAGTTCAFCPTGPRTT